MCCINNANGTPQGHMVHHRDIYSCTYMYMTIESNTGAGWAGALPFVLPGQLDGIQDIHCMYAYTQSKIYMFVCQGYGWVGLGTHYQLTENVHVHIHLVHVDYFTFFLLTFLSYFFKLVCYAHVHVHVFPCTCIFTAYVHVHCM